MSQRSKIQASDRSYIPQVVLSQLSLSESEQALFEACLVPRALKKGEFLLSVDTLHPAVGYLQAGLMRSFYLDAEGEEITAGFFQPDSFCTDLQSFQTGQKSQRNVEALTDCQLLVLDYKAQLTLRTEIEGWPYFEQNYIANLLLKKVSFQRSLANSSAAEAFALFRDLYPEAIRYAPRYQIASFLGISPFTLSRVMNA